MYKGVEPMVEAVCNDGFPFHFRNRKAIIGLTKQQFSFLFSPFNYRFFFLFALFWPGAQSGGNA